jgi:hypothetical protein
MMIFAASPARDSNSPGASASSHCTTDFGNLMWMASVGSFFAIRGILPLVCTGGNPQVGYKRSVIV